MFAGLRSSLFARITLIVVAAAAVMLLIVAGFGGAFFRYGKDALWGRHGAEYARVIAAQAAAAQNPADLEALAERLGVDIRYRGPRLIYATAALPGFEQAHPTRWWVRKMKARLRRYCPGDTVECRRRFREINSRVAVVAAAGRDFIHYQSGGHRLLIAVRDDGGVFAAAPWLWGGLALALAALFGGVYWLIRRALAPLCALESNLAAVGRGEWREMKTDRSDEIGRLIRGFNEMQRRIRRMFAAKERLLIDASHEFRTPLARIKLALELIGDRRAKTRIGEDIRELEQLTDDILQTRRAAGAPPLVKIHQAAEIVRAALAQIHPEARRFFDAAAMPDLQAPADLRQCARALKNLLENSLKYARPTADGEIKITVASGEIGDGKPAVEIRVADRGEGIPESELESIFEPFYRVGKSRGSPPARGRTASGGRAAVGGYGLGLPLAKAVAEAHGGMLTVTSAPGRGTTATIKLPVDGQPSVGGYSSATG